MSGVPKPKPVHYMNPPITGDYLPGIGGWNGGEPGWADLSGLVEFSKLDMGIVREIPNMSDAGPQLEPMWKWVRFKPGNNWCAAYQVWTWGRYFKSLNVSEENPDGFDPQVIKGIHAIRQQFARLGPANTSRLWHGRDAHSTVEGYDPRWVWYHIDQVISGEIEIRPGDLVYWGKPYLFPVETYNGTYNKVGHVGMCTGEIERNTSGKITHFHTVEGNTHRRDLYGEGSVVGPKRRPIDPEFTAGFLRYVGSKRGQVIIGCEVDFYKHLTPEDTIA